MPERFDEEYGDDAELGRLLRERLPRHPASPRLHAAILRAVAPDMPRTRIALWVAPAATAVATAMIMLLWIAPSLPPASSDPLRLLARAMITEHARTILWGQARPDMVPAVLPRVMEESGVALNWVFIGDDEIKLVDARPTYLEGRRGIELAYLDAEGHAVSYLILPAPTVTLPERGRVQIGKWRPLVRRENGFTLIIWKQQALLCVLVSDLVSESDLGRFKEYFVKVRSSTEPYVY
jgi:hypothetical protein